MAVGLVVLALVTSGCWDFTGIDLLTACSPVGKIEAVAVLGPPCSTNVAAGTTQGTGVAVSGGGRFVAFISNSSSLVPGDTNYEADVFVRDRELGGVQRVDVWSDGTQAANGNTQQHNSTSVMFPAMSADGRYVTFFSMLPLASGANGHDSYVHDRQTGTTELVNVGIDPSLTSLTGITAEMTPATISDDGRYVAFGTTGGYVFVRDRAAGTTKLVSLADDGTPASGVWPSISGNGRYVVYYSDASNIVPNDTNNSGDTFVYDTVTGTTERVNVTSAGEQSAYSAWMLPASISDDGRYVAFASSAWNLYGVGDPATWRGIHVFLRDRVGGTTEMIDSPGGHASKSPSISDDGRYVAYTCASCDTGSVVGVYVHDGAIGQTTRVGVTPDGQVPNGSEQLDYVKYMSGDGRYMTFESSSTNLVPNTLNGPWNTYVQRIS